MMDTDLVQTLAILALAMSVVFLAHGLRNIARAVAMLIKVVRELNR